ncbi:MAG: hypothetical protein KR126chlam3_00606 [Chlamydiae bacterium]|nr:hypothetical protein [Chlamydiota bacterium]
MSLPERFDGNSITGRFDGNILELARELNDTASQFAGMVYSKGEGSLKLTVDGLKLENYRKNPHEFSCTPPEETPKVIKIFERVELTNQYNARCCTEIDGATHVIFNRLVMESYSLMHEKRRATLDKTLA